jgi:sugar transferase (PEP-CTERM/EpsH1 system associated)
VNPFVHRDNPSFGQRTYPVRLLHVIDELALGGTELAMVRLARHLDPQRFQSQVCAFIPGPVEAELQAAALPYTILPKRRAFDLPLLLKLRASLKREGVQLVHCRSLQGILYGGLAAVLARVPFVCSIHGENTLRLQRAAPILRWSARCSRAFITVSESLKNLTAQTVGIPRERITVIYNGVDLNNFVQLGDADAMCHPSSASRSLMVGCVGMLRPVKGHRYLIEAIAVVREQVPHVHLCLVGDGPLHQELNDLCQTLGMGDNVSLLGKRDDVHALLRQFDVFALPSLSEGISNALLEAMSAGLPAVATNVGGNPEIVQHGVTGLLVPPQDSRALADALLQVLSDPDARQTMGRKGRERVEAHFSLPGMAQRYGEIYEQALAN